MYYFILLSAFKALLSFIKILFFIKNSSQIIYTAIIEIRIIAIIYIVNLNISIFRFIFQIWCLQINTPSVAQKDHIALHHLVS